jgi:type VI secretion system protein ImpF
MTIRVVSIETDHGLKRIMETLPVNDVTHGTLANSHTQLNASAGLSTTVTIFDRLTNHSAAGLPALTIGRSELNLTSLKESIINNLSGLLNTTHLEASRDLSRWKHIQSSVLNYGVPEINGALLSSVDAVEIERRMKQAIARFEPRLIRESVGVQIIADKSKMGPNSLQMVISGSFLEGELESSLHLNVQVDLESGRVSEIRT